MAKKIAATINVEGITADDVAVTLSAATGGRRLSPSGSGLQANYVITVPTSVADVSSTASKVVEKINAQSPEDMKNVVNGALDEASSSFTELGNVEVKGVEIKTKAAATTVAVPKREEEQAEANSAKTWQWSLILSTAMVVRCGI